MYRKSLLAMPLILIAMATASMTALAQDEQHHTNIELSPELAELLRAEMNQLAGGIQSVALSLAIADWQAIEKTSEKMHASYIMKQSLTESQAKELKQKLSPAFKLLDGAFHARAKKLGDAAAARDAELVAFHYSRLVEACVSCHSAFATQRFPGFLPKPQERHEH